MISDNNFNIALNVLDRLTIQDKAPVQPIQFEDEYRSHSPILTALKILNKSALEGSNKQKKTLLSAKHKIVALNKLLKSPSFNTVVSEKLGLEIDAKQSDVKGMQIALPKTSFEKMIEVSTRIPRIVFTLFLDILLLPGALVLILIACCKPNFNPKSENLKKGQIPILLLHGSGFNETEWLIGRQFLKKKNYGSVFSLNYDGLVSNDPKKGIEDYARDKISAEIKKIKELTGSDRVILIGHSMGGLIASYYAENLAEKDDVKIEDVMSIASPLRGTPSIDSFWKIGGPFSREKETKRHQQMSITGGTSSDPAFRQTLVAKALESERKGIRRYYSIWSTTDYAVPCESGKLTEDPRRQRSFNYLGHYALIAWPSVWSQTTTWLDQIYAKEPHAVTQSIQLKPIFA